MNLIQDLTHSDSSKTHNMDREPTEDDLFYEDALEVYKNEQILILNQN